MQRKDNMPDEVYWTLWGINSRFTAWCYAIGCLLIAIGCGIYALWQPIYLYGVFMVGASGFYIYAIRWVDKHSSWSDQ